MRIGAWFKSSRSGQNGACVEVLHEVDGGTLVRHSKAPDGAQLAFTEAEWSAFIDGAKAGEFDRP